MEKEEEEEEKLTAQLLLLVTFDTELGDAFNELCGPQENQVTSCQSKFLTQYSSVKLDWKSNCTCVSV